MLGSKTNHLWQKNPSFNDQTIGKMEDFAGQIPLIPPKRPAIPVL
jgi:hypothetical protein